MTSFLSKSTIIATLAAVAFSATLVAAPTVAEASPRHWGHGGHHSHHDYRRPGRAWGWGAAGLGAGIAVGAALAASSAYAYPADCYTVRRRVVDEFGDVYVRRVRVCN